MEVDTDDEILRTLAEGKSMDYEQWPALLPRLLSRLEKIVKEDFPHPTASAASSQPIPSEPPTTGDPSSQSSTQSTNKENAPPTSAPFPHEIQTLLKSITSTLNSLFTKYPPHTIQRLAELLLNPKQHYRTLISYLHAFDRVVHVTSGAHIFPLPPAIPDPSSLSLLSNGATGVNPSSVSWSNPATAPLASTLGSDESLGGALLTPITWLNRNATGTHSPLEGEVKTESTEMIEGPNGPGGIETVSVSVNGISSATASSSDSDLAGLRAEGGITQGELLRQEQRAGVVPAAQLQGIRGDPDGHGEDDEMPHARGPDHMTMEDMGPQREGNGSDKIGPGVGMQGIDIEAAIGRKIPKDDEDDEMKTEVEEESKETEPEPPTTPKRDSEEELAGDEKRLKSEELEEGEQKADEDMETVDADGNLPSDPKVDEEGETNGPNTIDTTNV